MKVAPPPIASRRAAAPPPAGLLRLFFRKIAPLAADNGAGPSTCGYAAVAELSLVLSRSSDEGTRVTARPWPDRTGRAAVRAVSC